NWFDAWISFLQARNGRKRNYEHKRSSLPYTHELMFRKYVFCHQRFYNRTAYIFTRTLEWNVQN
ncbi:hypothetical protein NPIL_311571, partial [Nephila pilipes]